MKSICLVLFLLLIHGCVLVGVTVTPIVIVVPASPPPSPTVTLSPMAILTSTPIPTAAALPTAAATETTPSPVSSEIPTPTSSAVPTPECDVLPEGNFLDIWRDNPDLQAALGCPTSLHPRVEPAAWEVSTAYQRFEHGEMIWSSHTGWYEQPVIYVLYEDGTYQRFEDTFDPQVDPASGGETPPTGLIEPMLGFGKVWREEPAVRNALGWATAPETPGSGRFQMFTTGEMIWIDQTNQTYVFSEGDVWTFDIPFACVETESRYC